MKQFVKIESPTQFFYPILLLKIATVLVPIIVVSKRQFSKNDNSESPILKWIYIARFFCQNILANKIKLQCKARDIFVYLVKHTKLLFFICLVLTSK